MKSLVPPSLPDLRKPSGCIHVNHNLSGPAQRLYNCLLAYIQDDIPDVDGMPEFQVPTEVVREYMHTRADDRIKKYLRELRRSDFEFNNIEKGGPKWGCYGFIDNPEIVGSYIRFSIAPRLRLQMTNTNMFARISMLVERTFKKTKHAQPIYELGLDYRDNKDPVNGKGCTPWMDIEFFRKYMGLNPGEFKTFKSLNQLVIQKALKELESESDIRMALEKELKSRQVVKIRFVITDNKMNMSIKERLRRIQKTLPGIDDEKAVEHAKIVEDMVNKFDMNRTVAKRLARLYVGKIPEFLQVSEDIMLKKLAGKVKNLGAYAAKTFEKENPTFEIEK